MDYKLVAIAFAHQEGFYVNGSIPQRANNPGDLELGDNGHGTIEGKTIYSNVDDGWEALYRQVEMMLSGNSHVYPLNMTLAEVGLTYSGGDPNWGKNVASMLNVPETITLAELAEFEV